MGKGAYLRDYWNWIDFIIIIQVITSWFLESSIINGAGQKSQIKLNSLRVLRIMIPLKSLRNVEGLKILVISLLHALPLLRDSFIILSFFYLLFALAGLHNFHGNYKRRCFSLDTGVESMIDELWCREDTDCPDTFICGQSLVLNPNLDITSFDNIFYSLLTVFQCVTLEGWSYVMLTTMKTSHPMAFIFFIFLIFFGAFFMVNLTLAVINNKFTEAHNFYEEQRQAIEWQKKHKFKGLSFTDQIKAQLGGGDGGQMLLLDHDEMEFDEDPDVFNKQLMQGIKEGGGKQTLKKHIQASSLKGAQRLGLTIRQFMFGKKAAKQMIKFLRIQQQKAKVSKANQKRRVTLFGKIIAQPRVLPVAPPRRSIIHANHQQPEIRKSRFLAPSSNQNKMAIGRPSVFMQAIQENQIAIVEEDSSSAQSKSERPSDSKSSQSESFDINASQTPSENPSHMESQLSANMRGSIYNTKGQQLQPTPPSDIVREEELKQQSESEIVIEEEMQFQEQHRKGGIRTNFKIDTKLAQEAYGFQGPPTDDRGDSQKLDLSIISKQGIRAGDSSGNKQVGTTIQNKTIDLDNALPIELDHDMNENKGPTSKNSNYNTAPLGAQLKLISKDLNADKNDYKFHSLCEPPTGRELDQVSQTETKLKHKASLSNTLKSKKSLWLSHDSSKTSKVSSIVQNDGSSSEFNITRNIGIEREIIIEEVKDIDSSYQESTRPNNKEKRTTHKYINKQSTQLNPSSIDLNEETDTQNSIVESLPGAKPDSRKTIHRNTMVAGNFNQLLNNTQKRLLGNKKESAHNVMDLRRQSGVSQYSIQNSVHRLPKFKAINNSTYQHSNYDKISIASSAQSPYLRSNVLNKRGSVEKEAQQLALNVLKSHQEKLQNNIFFQLRMRSLKDKEKSKLDQIMDAQKQKIVLNPNHEYFSSSHLDVMQGRLDLLKKFRPYDEQIRTLEECAVGVTGKGLKPYEKRVKYHLSSSFADQYQDVSYRVFNLMMQEDENLRHRHQDQPYEAATSSLLDIYENNRLNQKKQSGIGHKIDIQSLKLVTRRTDLIMTSTLAVSLIPKRMPEQQHDEEKTEEFMVNIFPPLESDYSQSEHYIEERKNDIVQPEILINHDQRDEDLTPIGAQIDSQISETPILLQNNSSLQDPYQLGIRGINNHNRRRSFNDFIERRNGGQEGINSIHQLFRSTGDFMRQAYQLVTNQNKSSHRQNENHHQRLSMSSQSSISKLDATNIVIKQDSIFEKSPRVSMMGPNITDLVNQLNQGATSQRQLRSPQFSAQFLPSSITPASIGIPPIQILQPAIEDQEHHQTLVVPLSNQTYSSPNLIRMETNQNITTSVPQGGYESSFEYHLGPRGHATRMTINNQPEERLRLRGPSSIGFTEASQNMMHRVRKSKQPKFLLDQIINNRLGQGGSRSPHPSKSPPPQVRRSATGEQRNKHRQAGSGTGRNSSSNHIRNYRRKTIERKSKKVQEMSIAQAQDFFHGKFYSSDEESEVRVKRKRRERQKNILSSPPKNISSMSLLTVRKVFGGRRIRDSMERSNHQVLSLGRKFKSKFSVAVGGSSNNLEVPQSSMSLGMQRRVTLLSNMDKERCIQMDIQDHLLKNKRNSVITGGEEFQTEIQITKSKTFLEDADYFNKFLEKFVESKEIKARNPLDIVKTEQSGKILTAVEDDLSDLIPSSLESDYEDVKMEQRKQELAKSFSFNYAIISSDIKEAYSKSQFDLATLNKIDSLYAKSKNRFNGTDVLAYSLNNLEKAQRVVRMLGQVRVWPKRDKSNCSCKRNVTIARAMGKNFLKSQPFEYFMTLCVILNIVVLAFDSQSNQAGNSFWSMCNLVFTCLFTLETIIKLLSLGFGMFTKDSMNSVDAVIVIISTIELISQSVISGMKGGSTLSAFRIIRIFRVMRVLRMMRLLRQLQSMQIIIGVIKRSIKSFMYIAILLLIFLFIYAILAMQLFGDIYSTHYPYNSAVIQTPLSRANYDTFHNAFINVFQVMTITNWHIILYDTMYYTSESAGGGSQGLYMRAVTALYFVSFILIGNYILLNLFLAVLIDSFLKEGESERASQKVEDNKQQELIAMVNKEKGGKEHDDEALKKRKSQPIEKKKSFIRRQTISRPLANLLTQLKDTSEDNNLSSQQDLLHALSTLGGGTGKLKEKQGSLDLLKGLFNKVQEQGDKQAQEENGQLIIEDDLNDEEKAQIVETLTNQMNYELDFLSNQNLLDLSQGITPLKNTELQSDLSIMFKNVGCQVSLFLFKKRNKFRSFCMRAIRHRYFDRFILLTIIANSAKLAIETYFLDCPATSVPQQIFTELDFAFTVIFTLESSLKIVALGLFLEKGAYLRSTENMLDFFIVVTSIIDNILTNTNDTDSSLGNFKVLRLLRTFRPLRIVTHSQSMQILITTLISSISGIANVVLLLLVVWLMFAILGVSLFSQRLVYCSHASLQNTQELYRLSDPVQCNKEGGYMMSYPYNFDTVENGILTLLIVSSLNNWDQLMYQAVDSTGEGSGPMEDRNPLYAYFYVGFILIGAFFFLNFLIGVLFLNFKTVSQQRNTHPQSIQTFGKTRTDEEEEVRACWRDMQRLIVQATPPDFYENNGRSLDTLKESQSKQAYLRVKHRVRKSLAGGGKLDLVFTSCLILNTIQMCMYYDEASAQYTLVLDMINQAFTYIYTIEAMLKLWTAGCSNLFPRYFQNPWNKFDFLIVAVSIAEIIVSSVIQTNLRALKAVPQIIRLLRVVRIARILRLVGKYEGLQALISTIIFSLPQLLSVFALLLILLFVFAILGVFLFKDIVRGEIIDIASGGYMGFGNFGLAMLMLFRLTTGEDWSNVLTDTQNPMNCINTEVDCTSVFSVFYFVGFNLLCTYMMLNLFVLIALEQFDRYYLPRDNVMARFRRDLETFSNVWSELADAPETQNYSKLKDTRIAEFMRKLKPPLGIMIDKLQSQGYTALEDGQVHREILKMGIRIDQNGYVHFHELLYRVMKRLYGMHELLRDLDMQLFELITQHKIHSKTQANLDSEHRLLLGFKRKSSLSVSKVADSSRIEIITPPVQTRANPFLTNMVSKLAFKAWLNEARESQGNAQAKDESVEVCFDVYEDVVVPAKEETSDESEEESLADSEIKQDSSSKSEEDVTPPKRQSFIPRDSMAMRFQEQPPSASNFLNVPR
ncbi:hypothetical protein FGO68_gene13672 [Halteria grandinella]|uniref:Ion transport domain-containing protein n=1 Tax=Halteria grandinella TaxID=5974 RepID=A0A8J8P9Z6_HALGN|nr:hypothetical protein FGO68_gene13672 [Halteria grandinella]